MSGQTPAAALSPVSLRAAPARPRQPVVGVPGEAGVPLGQDVLHAVTPPAPAPGAPPLEGSDAPHTPVRGLGCDGGVVPGQAEVEARQTSSLLLDNSVHLPPVAQSDGELVDQDPDEDEEKAPDKREKGKGCLEGVLAVREDSEVKDLVEAAPEACEDDSAVVELPGEEEQPLLSPHSEYQQEAGEEPHESDHQHRAHNRQGVHHGLHLRRNELRIVHEVFSRTYL